MKSVTAALVVLIWSNQLLAATASQPTTRAASAARCGAISERTIAGVVSGNSALDLDRNAFHKSIDAKSIKAMYDWLHQSGVDVMALVTPPRGLMAWEMAVVPANEEDWEIAPAELQRRVAAAKLVKQRSIPIINAHPATVLIKPREGGMGVLQVLGMTDDEQGVRVRFRMLVGGAPPTTVATTKPAK